MKIFYSDELVTVNDIIINVPFKEDSDYNTKIRWHFKKFLEKIAQRIRFSFSEDRLILFDNPFSGKEKDSVNICINHFKNENSKVYFHISIRQ
jgi:hypothetical protein